MGSPGSVYAGHTSKNPSCHFDGRGSYSLWFHFVPQADENKYMAQWTGTHKIILGCGYISITERWPTPQSFAFLKGSGSWLVMTLNYHIIIWRLTYFSKEVALDCVLLFHPCGDIWLKINDTYDLAKHVALISKE